MDASVLKSASIGKSKRVHVIQWTRPPIWSSRNTAVICTCVKKSYQAPTCACSSIQIEIPQFYHITYWNTHATKCAVYNNYLAKSAYQSASNHSFAVHTKSFSARQPLLSSIYPTKTRCNPSWLYFVFASGLQFNYQISSRGFTSVFP